MSDVDAQVPPEQMVADMNRSRHWKVFGAIGGLILALVLLFGATMAMYNDERATERPSQVQFSLQP
ncbi:MAG TPA: hypothetical protein VJU61_07950 [Polyangiaceae bacterium]|nr:hypothetical protein [Polyangiaceae bacterium]